eukprot:354731-Chlamydomonas_euryale.AAC.11
MTESGFQGAGPRRICRLARVRVRVSGSGSRPGSHEVQDHASKEKGPRAGTKEGRHDKIRYDHDKIYRHDKI